MVKKMHKEYINYILKLNTNKSVLTQKVQEFYSSLMLSDYFIKDDNITIENNSNFIEKIHLLAFSTTVKVKPDGSSYLIFFKSALEDIISLHTHLLTLVNNRDNKEIYESLANDTSYELIGSDHIRAYSLVESKQIRSKLIEHSIFCQVAKRPKQLCGHYRNYKEVV